MASRVSICFMVFIVCLLASSLTRIGAKDSESKEFVLTLDHSNFFETVSKHDFIVVEFYALW
jgi:protein disulfide-isomerase A1